MENNCTNITITSKQIEDVYSHLKEEIIKGEHNKTNNTIIQTENAIFQIATIKEQQKSKYLNISSIEMDECEKIIKEKYNILKEDELIILKTDIYDRKSSLYVQYEIYNPYTLEYIPLDICNDVKININIPINLNEDTESLYLSLNNSGYNLFNSSDSFYNDICSTYTTENGTDITLLDRKNIIYDNNKNIFLCQDGCEFAFYNETTKKSKCNCEVQKYLTITDIKNISFSKKELIDNFLMTSLKNSNFKVVKCYELIFSKKGLKNNIGNYILLGIIFILIIAMIFYCIKGNKKLNDYIQTVIKQKFVNNNKTQKKSKKENVNMDKNKIKKNIKFKRRQKKSNTYKSNKKSNISTQVTKAINIKKKKIMKTIVNPPKVKKVKEKDISILKSDSYSTYGLNKNLNNKELLNNSLNNNSNKNIIRKRNIKNKKNNNISLFKNQKFKEKNKDKKKVTIIGTVNKVKFYNKNLDKPLIKNNNNFLEKEIIIFNDEEINSLDYKKALIYDKRTYFQYYFSLIRKKHLILFTFLPSNDYNLNFIKISLFLLSFSLYFTVNAFFFTDKTMHKILIDNGKYNFIFQIPQIIYSAVISSVINKILKNLSLSEPQILSIKKEQNLKNASKKGKIILKSLRIKFVIFFILSFILSFIFWYFITGFCAVYKNTQIILIENTVFSFSTSMLYTFGLNLLPGMFRIPALRNNKKNKDCLYKFSKLVSMIS